jgi:hypothetical protein
MIQGKQSAVTTNGAGQATITFPTAFSGTPIVMVSNATGTATYVSLGAVDATSFGFGTFNPAVISGPFTVNWIAMGTKV